MSYDFSLRIPAALRKRKGKKGPHPEQLQRLQRAREILLAFEPDLVIEDDEGMFTARSATLGDVFVECDRISLGMSMGTEPRVVYGTIHTLMGLFRSEGYEANDPQVRGEIVHRDDFGEFMRQYRAQFRCNDEEFNQWCRGETPTAWAERAAVRAKGDAVASVALPRGWELDWHQQKALSDDALWAHLQDVIRRNDEAIAAHDLGAYMHALSHVREHDFRRGARRLDGTYYPDPLTTRWFQSSMLHYEANVLSGLKGRGYPAALRDRPQCVTVVFDLPGDEPIDNAWDERVRKTTVAVYALLLARGLISYGSDSTSRLNRWECNYYGDDADAIHAALAAFFADPGRVAPVRMSKRYGEFGAAEVEIAFSRP